MKATIMYRNTFDGGDGWTYFPTTIEIGNFCPKCGGPRGEPVMHRQHEDGEWFTVSRWDNPCGHLDTYEELATKNAGRVFEQMEWE